MYLLVFAYSDAVYCLILSIVNNMQCKHLFGPLRTVTDIVMLIFLNY